MRVESERFTPRAESETPAAYGLRALVFVMRTDQTFSLSDDALEAGAHAARAAVALRGTTAQTADAIALTAARMRSMLQARKADRARSWAALCGQLTGDAPAAIVDAAPVVDAGDAGNGGGGSKVPRTVAPKPKSPQGSAMVPPAALPAPVAVADWCDAPF